MWVAVVVIVVGAVFLFRQGGDDVPTGIGEQRTVITSEASYQALEEGNPRSGDVDIAGQESSLVPEKPEDGQTEAAPKETVKKTAPPKQVTEASQSSLPVPDTKPDPILPLPSGGWVVQVGSFGSAENADKEAARLKKSGWDALVKVGNTSDGTIIYRVRIGYFKSRSDSEKFIRENRKTVGGAIAVHR
jgi:cell division septation protein DedD